MGFSINPFLASHACLFQVTDALESLHSHPFRRLQIEHDIRLSVALHMRLDSTGRGVRWWGFCNINSDSLLIFTTIYIWNSNQTRDTSLSLQVRFFNIQASGSSFMCIVCQRQSRVLFPLLSTTQLCDAAINPVWCLLSFRW